MIKLDDYREIVGDNVIGSIYKKMRSLYGKHLLNINSTYIGGGVAEILASMIPLMNDVGLDAGWRTVHGNMDFYGINNGSNFFVYKRRDSDNVVLELKYDQINDQSAHNIANHFPFRMLRNSKYLAGIESVVL